MVSPRARTGTMGRARAYVRAADSRADWRRRMPSCAGRAPDGAATTAVSAVAVPAGNAPAENAPVERPEGTSSGTGSVTATAPCPPAVQGAGRGQRTPHRYQPRTALLVTGCLKILAVTEQ